MRCWRVARQQALDGYGGFVVSGRWHTQGRAIIYASEHPATAAIEWLVHLEVSISHDAPRTIPFMEIDVPDGIACDEITRRELPIEWEKSETITRAVGDAWLVQAQTALCYVPSAVIPARNVLVNPSHRDVAGRLRITQTFEFALDPRLV